MFAIQEHMKKKKKKMGQLPMEISKISKCLLDRGTFFQELLTLIHYRRSPLIRVGLKISCEIIIKLTKGECTKALKHMTPY